MDYVDFNGIKDEFLLENLMFSVDEPVILKKKPNAIYSLKPLGIEFSYPLIVSANENDYLYFYTKFSITISKEEIKEAFNSIKTLGFELEYKYKDIHKAHLKSSKVNINTNMFYEKYEQEKREVKELIKSFDGKNSRNNIQGQYTIG